MDKELGDIFREAGELSYGLWTQKPDFKFLDIKALPRRFDRGNNQMEPHQLHRELLDMDGGCLDGKDIVLVTHPALLAYGTAEGTEYCNARVLKKAVVWLGPPSHLSAQRPTKQGRCMKV
jgi:hypothetical protein